MKDLRDLASQDAHFRGAEFGTLVKCYAAHRGSIPNAANSAVQAHAPERVRQVLKAAVGAGSTSLGSPSAWGDELVGYKPLAEGFFASLRGRSVFFRLLQDGAFARTPMRTRIAVQVSNLTGSVVGPGRAKPVSRFDLTADALEPLKAVAQVVVTEELLAATGAGAEAAFNRELRGGVADVVDSHFFELIGQGLTPQTASAASDADLQAMLDVVNTTGSGKLYWAMRPAMANRMSTMLTAGNIQAFPTMTPVGGTLAGLPAVVSTQVPAVSGSPVSNSLWLIDASGIAADSTEIEVRMSRQAAVQMDTAPTGDAVNPVGLGSTTLVSLWQQNLTAILAEVRFAALRYRANAVAVLEGVAW